MMNFSFYEGEGFLPPPKPPEIPRANTMASQINISTAIEENRKVFVSKIPKGTSDDFMERLLKCCGTLTYWKRTTDASGVLMAFGQAEYEQIESVFACQKLLNNLALFDSRLQVKADQKTCQFLNDWKELKKMDWISKQEKSGVEVSPEDLDNQEQAGDILPYERELIPFYDDIIEQINRTIENREIIEQVASSQKASNESVSKHQYEDPFSKYKEHEREQRREKKTQQQEEDKEQKFRRKLEEWQSREANREKEKEREKERDKEKAREKAALVQKDLAYDSAEEKKKKKKDPKLYQRHLEERKRVREKEKEDDELDRVKEEEEQKELEKRMVEERKKQEEQRKKDEEIRERLKLKRFIEMQEKMERDQLEQKRLKTQEDPISMGISQQRPSESNVAMNEPSQEDSTFKKSHKPMPISDNIKQTIQGIDSDLKSKRNKKDAQKPSLSEFAQDEQKRLLLEKSKQLYKILPKSKTEVFSYQINWSALYKHEVVEKVARPWLQKKVKEYLGSEEQHFIQSCVKLLNQKASASQMKAHVKDILDKATEEFVLKLWQALIFENMKIDEGLYK